jgi:hypothetical protein
MAFCCLSSDLLQTWSVGASEFFLRYDVIKILDCFVFTSGKAGGVRSIFISLSSFSRFIVFPLLLSPIHSQIAHALQIVFHLEKYQKNCLSLEFKLSRNLSKVSTGFLINPYLFRPGSPLGVDLPFPLSRETTLPRLVSLGPGILTVSSWKSTRSRLTCKEPSSTR